MLSPKHTWLAPKILIESICLKGFFRLGGNALQDHWAKDSSGRSDQSNPSFDNPIITTTIVKFSAITSKNVCSGIVPPGYAKWWILHVVPRLQRYPRQQNRSAAQQPILLITRTTTTTTMIRHYHLFLLPVQKMTTILRQLSICQRQCYQRCCQCYRLRILFFLFFLLSV